MDNKHLGEFIKALDSDFEIKEGKQFTEVTVTPAKLHSLASQLRENEETLLDFLVSVTGVDYVPDLGVIYHLRSTKHGHTVVIKSRTSDREDPQLDSVSDIWEAAELHEREVFDLFGIRFANHPDLRRLFLNSSWGFPLRKDYVEDDIITW